MRTIYLAIAITLACLSMDSARGDLVAGDDPRFGSNSLTLDTQTGLAWLDLTFSLGLSREQVLAGMMPGGIYSDYRYATSAEVVSLYLSAGIPGVGLYPLSGPQEASILNLIALLGATHLSNGAPAVSGISGTPYGPGIVDGVFQVPRIYLQGDSQWSVSDGSGFGFGYFHSEPHVGSWLVKPIPESSTVTLLFLGGSALAGLAICRRRSKQRGY